MATRYIHATAEQEYDWWYAGRCMTCGDASQESGCVCRYCESCSDYWVREDGVRACGEGRPAREICPDCIAWAESPEGYAELERQRIARVSR